MAAATTQLPELRVPRARVRGGCFVFTDADEPDAPVTFGGCTTTVTTLRRFCSGELALWVKRHMGGGCKLESAGLIACL